MDSETPGSRIRAKRLALGITQEKLSSLVGLNVRTINRIEVNLTPIATIADYLHLIAAELGTTPEILRSGEVHSERITREALQSLRKDGTIRNDQELERLCGFAMEAIKKRSNAKVPLSRQDLLNLIEVIRGADGH